MISNNFKIHGLAFMAGHRQIMAVIYMEHGVSHERSEEEIMCLLSGM